MARKPAISPRKAPRQARSKSLVEAILTAAARILEASGYDDSTTNRIAEKAGVSVGSLYQYFPNKDALVAALIDRSIESNVRMLEGRVAELRDRPVEELIDVLVDTLSGAFLDDRRALRPIYAHATRVARVESLLAARRRFTGIFSALMRERRQEIAVEDPDAGAFVLVNAVMGVIQIAIVDGQSDIPSARISAELKGLARGYLRRATPRRARY